MAVHMKCQFHRVDSIGNWFDICFNEPRRKRSVQPAPQRCRREIALECFHSRSASCWSPNNPFSGSSGIPLSQLSQGPQQLIDFDAEITREDKDILESIDPDALGDLRRRGVEYSMDSDRPGILIWRKMMVLLASHGESEVHRNAGAGRVDHFNTAATESAGAA